MANIVQVAARLQDGRIASLYDASVSDNTTTAVSTGGSGLAQTPSLSLGQAYPNSIITHIGATVEGAVLPLSTSPSSRAVMDSANT